jgi:rubrerythrin
VEHRKGVDMMTGVDKVLGPIVQAIEIEMFGYDFYYNMREFVKDIDGQKLVSYLGRLEVDHIKWLEEEYDRQLGKLSEFEERPKVDLSLLAKGEIFLDSEKLPEIFKDFDPQHALTFAIQIEKRSIEFYERARETSEDDSVRELFQKLADFERDHIVLLNDNLTSLKENGTWIPLK